MNTNSFRTRENQQEGIEIKQFIFMLYKHWYWFLISAVLGLGLSYVYSKTLKQQYLVNSTILVPQKSTALDMNSLFEGGMSSPLTNIYNQIGIIKSYQTIQKTMQSLNWRTSWYKKDFFRWQGLYQKDPFEIKEPQGFSNPAGIPLQIVPVSNDNYTVTGKGIMKIGEKLTKVDFSGEGVFGKEFKNKYLNFTLSKKLNTPLVVGAVYRLIFNSIKDQTLSYRGRINAKIVDEYSDMIDIMVAGDEPSKEVDLLNELIRVYMNDKMNIQSEGQRRTLEFINSQLTGMTDSLLAAEVKFTKFRSENNIFDLGEQGAMVMGNLKEIESERAKSQMQLDYFQSMSLYLAGDGDPQKMVSPSVVGIEDMGFRGMVVKLSELYSKRQLTSFSAKDNNPALMIIDKELNQIKDQLLENLRNLIINVRQSINTLKNRENEIALQMNKLPEKEQQMINVKRKFDLTSEIYTFLEKKRAETNMALASTIPDVQIIDIARIETALPIGVTTRSILLIGLLIGLALPMALFVVFKFLDTRIHTQEEIERNTTLPILGNIFHSKDQTELVVFEQPRSGIAESFRALRTNLQFMIPEDRAGIICIHSVYPGEGKSYNAVNIASVLAMNSKKVVLIGADVRKPRTNKIFNMDNSHGLSTYLIGHDNINEVIFETIIENLSVIPSGPVPPNPAEILGRKELKTLLDELSRRYDYVIIDNAPVGIVTDGFIIGKLADLNIFILRYGKSQKHQVEQINQYAAKKMVDHVALVVNDIKNNGFGYSYNKYSNYEHDQKKYYSIEDGGTKKVKRERTKN